MIDSSIVCLKCRRILSVSRIRHCFITDLEHRAVKNVIIILTRKISFQSSPSPDIFKSGFEARGGGVQRGGREKQELKTFLNAGKLVPVASGVTTISWARTW